MLLNKTNKENQLSLFTKYKQIW